MFEARTEEGTVQHRRPKTSRPEEVDTDDEEDAASSKKQKKVPSPVAQAPDADGVELLANAATEYTHNCYTYIAQHTTHKHTPLTHNTKHHTHMHCTTHHTQTHNTTNTHNTPYKTYNR